MIKGEKYVVPILVGVYIGPFGTGHPNDMYINIHFSSSIIADEDLRIN